ncbi:PREDICTED: maternal B9.15 protein-like [Nanorana parkeri]|uniref:maternal B9.15 protein-like n=1 Tax=Nanorana parkeri TaxID=125878 RepID=UPI0008545642|nr:PREDICTED: maternal B9.15 protein-like [Nanorana parkeri]
MHLEIAAAVDFLMKVFSLKKTLKSEQLDSLGKNLACLLNDRYRGHWHPDKPAQGQAYRCIRINSWQYVDESLLQACTHCGIEYSRLPLPDEITIWIDPFEVCGRLGEHTDYFTIATFQPVTNEEPASLSGLYTERETSDYSSDGPSSESVSENSSDDETSGDKPEKVEVVVPPNCASPDEAIDSPTTSTAGTPVSELLAADQEMDGTDASDAQEATYV